MPVSYTHLDVYKRQGEESTRYTVDFEELWKVNEDIIAWIRFDEPSIISYPVVQGKDNQEYLDKTISVSYTHLDVYKRQVSARRILEAISPARRSLRAEAAGW